MNALTVRRSFILFHLVLGLGILALSVGTLRHALAPENRPTHQHIALIAAIEAIGAVLLLVPRTLRPGALLLLATIGLALVIHTAHGEWRPDLAIYAAGVWLLYAHGSGWQREPSSSTAA